MAAESWSNCQDWAAICLFVERHESNSTGFKLDVRDYVKENIKLDTVLLNMNEFVGRNIPGKFISESFLRCKLAV